MEVEERLPGELVATDDDADVNGEVERRQRKQATPTESFVALAVIDEQDPTGEVDDIGDVELDAHACQRHLDVRVTRRPPRDLEAFDGPADREAVGELDPA